MRSKTVNIEMIQNTGATSSYDFFTKKKEELNNKPQSFNDVLPLKNRNN